MVASDLPTEELGTTIKTNDKYKEISDAIQWITDVESAAAQMAQQPDTESDEEIDDKPSVAEALEK